MNIYVSNLNFSSTSESLKELFEEHGQVTSANIISDKFTGDSRGYGFVEMPDDTEGKKAIEELHETEFEGKTLNVNVARPKTERNSGHSGNQGGGGYYRRKY